MNIVGQVPLGDVGVSFEYMTRSGIAGSQGRTIPRVLRKCQIDFQSGCTSLHSYQQWRSVLLAPHPCQPELSLVLLLLAILTAIRWNLKVVFISMSLMAKDVEHIFVSQPFEIPLLRILCLVLYPIFKFDYLVVDI